MYNVLYDYGSCPVFYLGSCLVRLLVVCESIKVFFCCKLLKLLLGFVTMAFTKTGRKTNKIITHSGQHLASTVRVWSNALSFF